MNKEVHISISVGKGCMEGEFTEGAGEEFKSCTGSCFFGGRKGECHVGGRLIQEWKDLVLVARVAE